MSRINVVETVLRCCRADPVVARGGPVVVAVSGGPDSTALLHALWRAAPRLRLELTAAHLDHGLRRASRGDAERVAQLCRSLDVALVSRRTVLPAGQRSEDGARRARHGFLEDVAREIGAGTIALGHTADDQAETILLHLIRGAGLEGLAGMAPREGMRFRPLLRLWRDDIEAYCRRHRLQPVQDATNKSPRFLRNRVRFELLPALQKFNPRIKASLSRLGEAARDEHDVIAGLAGVWLTGRSSPYPREAFAAQPAGVQTEILRRIWAEAQSGDQPPGDAARLTQAVALIADGHRRGMIALGAGLHLHVGKDSFHVGRRARE